MYLGFWKKLKKPFFALAPMADVTDAAFRKMIAKRSGAGRGSYVTWTEFVSADGLCSKSGRARLLLDLKYSEIERPIVAQIFGATPEHFYEAALLVKELGFDGIDINMGCPDRAVERQGAGAALIKNPELAKKIIRETKRAAEGKSAGRKIPVSVKTRIGYARDEIKTWLPHLLEAEPAALIFHLRTRKEMSKVPARWDAAAEIVFLVCKYIGDKSKRPLIIGNGDVGSVEEGKILAEKTGVDGVMIGRGVLGNPFLFNPEKPARDFSPEERVRALLEHAAVFEKFYFNKKTGEWIKNFDVMKKHFKAYISGFALAKELRDKLMKAKNKKEIEMTVDKWSNGK